MLSANEKIKESSDCLGRIKKYLISKEIHPEENAHLFPVYLATYSDDDQKESKRCVIKAIPDLNIFQRELKVYQLAPHSNILQCIDVIENFPINFGRFAGDSYNLLVFPYLENGDFLDYVNKAYLKESILRYYVEQILNAVEYLHKNGFAHRDIKPENVLLDDMFNLILIDFGHTVEHSDGKGEILFNSYSDGTSDGICPPEFRKRIGYFGTRMDIFALGKMIFTLATGMRPFSTTKPGDLYYRMIEKEQWEVYWSRVETSLKGRWKTFDGLSSDLKELLQSMLCSISSKRPTIEEVRSSNWYKNVQPAALDEIQCFMIRLKLAA